MRALLYATLITLLFPIINLIVQAVGLDYSMLSHIANTTLCNQLVTTTQIMLYVTLISTAIALPLSWVFSSYEFKFKHTLEFFAILPLAVPSFVFATIWREYIPPSNSILEYSFICSITLYPYIFLVTKNLFQQQSKTYYDLGESLGILSYSRLILIHFPLIFPGLLESLMIVLMESVSDYGTAQIMGVQTITVGIYKQWFGFLNPLVASQLCLGLMIFFVVLNSTVNSFKQKISNPSTSFYEFIPKKISGLRTALVASVTIIISSIGFIIPVSVLCYWSYLSAFKINLALLGNDALNTLFLGGMSLIMCAFLSIFLTFLYRNIKYTFIDKIFLSSIKVLYGMPSIIIGIALLAITGELYQTEIGFFFDTIWIIVIGYMMKYLFLLYINTENSINQIPKSFDEICMVYGQNKIKTFFKFLMPYLYNSLFLGCLLATIDMIRELPIVLMLHPGGFTTLAMRVFTYSHAEMVYRSGLWSLLIIIFTLPFVFFLKRMIKNVKY